MNILFWALLLLMLLVAVVILIYPLLRVRSTESIAYKDSNLGLYDDKLAELEADLGEGRIDHEQYQQARVEIDRELLQDIPEESRETASLHYGARLKRQPGLALMISVFLPMVALLVYMKLGMHAASTGVPQSQVQAQSSGSAQAQAQAQQDNVGSIEEMTRKLAERIKQQGGNLEEWTMLARAYKHMGQYALAAEAFEQAVQMNPSAQLMLEQSEAIALGNNQQFTPQATALVMRALEMEPDNLNVLWFAGVAEFQAGNYRNSIEHLSRLSEQAKQDPEIDRSLRLYIDKARSELLAAGEEVPSTDQIMGATAASGDVANGVAAGGEASLQVKVGVSDDVRSRFAAGDAVFVYAKAAAGPKMPLAVQRLTLEQLPATITLDDSMAMMEGMNMSAFGSVVVSARVTKTGSAIAKAGDYIGQSEVEDVTKAELVEIQIDTIVQ
ncbi:MAG: c-type cytochrome biogenesis protein CcmI [Gammaproteobacteria bacterium]|nr:c-type cytochrome biogenesis protein CcmI [Gammaproteobacteria bacterium]NNL06969.1 c-type cytochrome biogenesis protein CcmI [Gammaproteobacteria bacterium]